MTAAMPGFYPPIAPFQPSASQQPTQGLYPPSGAMNVVNASPAAIQPRLPETPAPTDLRAARPGNGAGLAALHVAHGAASVANADITTYQISGDGVVITEQTVFDRLAGTGWGTQTTINGDGIQQQTEGAFIDTQVGIGGDGINGDIDVHGPEHGDIEDPTCFGGCFEGIGDGIGSFFSGIGEAVTTGISSAFSAIGGAAAGMRDAVTSVDLSCIGEGISGTASAFGSVFEGIAEAAGSCLSCFFGAVGAVLGD